MEREAKTSGVPFVALPQGRQAWAPLLDELKPRELGAGDGRAGGGDGGVRRDAP